MVLTHSNSTSTTPKPPNAGFLSLTPEQAVVEDGHRWLPIKFDKGIPRGRWISLGLRSSLFDPLTRPVIRFRTPDEDINILIPAPLMGTSAWIGYVPKNATAVWISPGHLNVNSTLEIETLNVLSWSELLGALIPRSIRWTIIALWLWLVGRHKDSRWVIQLNLEATRLADYHEWRSRAMRPFDPVGIDRPRTDWHSGPRIYLLLEAPTHRTEPKALATFESLHQQAYPNWFVIFVTTPGATMRNSLIDDLVRSGRAVCVSCSQRVADQWPENHDSAIVTPLTLGDMLPAYALATLAEYASAHPEVSVIYGDEESIDQEGRYCDPELKPDWSPIFQGASPYIDQAIYFRVAALLQDPTTLLSDLPGLSQNSKLATLLSDGSVGHLRRIMLTKSKRPGPDNGKNAEKCTARNGVERSPGRQACPSDPSMPLASIIIPSKDRSRLLAECLASLSATRPINFEIIIVDNGSKEKRTQELYATLQHDERIRIISSPGVFNFSHLCNQGAAIARGSVLVFLNNDTAALSNEWLAELIKWADQPNVGAVGAKLLYPSRRLQHGGVVLGVHGVAGHVDLGAAQEESGYLGRLVNPREVSAVTGACLAVAKAKFDSVAGFDADRFPVELNDIDLCLRLTERGWKTVFAPDALMGHRESATRGRAKRPEATYRHELTNFRLLWQARFHDDPYFHPALSLHPSRTMLA